MINSVWILTQIEIGKKFWQVGHSKIKTCSDDKTCILKYMNS